MATFKEQLAILITADGKQAAAQFDALGASAKKNLGQTDDKLKKLSSGLTTVGVAAVGAGAVAGVGLFKLAQASSSVGEQMSATNKIFGDATGQVEAFADQASTSAGVSKVFALEATNRFSAFGKQLGLTGESLAGFSTGFVQLAGDLASFKDLRVEDAIDSIGSALAGESEPMMRLGVDTRVAALELDHLARTGEDVSGSMTQQQKLVAVQSVLYKELGIAAGDFVDTSGSLANQQRSLAAELSNTAAALGEGLEPAFAGVMVKVNELLGGFNDLGDGTKKTVGSVMGVATAATVAVGGVSLLTGALLNTKDKFDRVRDAATSATGEMTRFGRVGRTLAIGGGLVAGVLILKELSDYLKTATTDTEALDAAQIRLSSANGVAEMMERIGKVTKENESGWEKFWEFGGIDDNEFDLGGVTVELDKLDKVFETLKDDPEQLQLATDALSSALKEQGIAAPAATSALAKWQEHIDATTEAQVREAEATAAATSSIEDLTSGMESAGVAGEFFAGSVDNMAAAGEALAGSLESNPFASFTESAFLSGEAIREFAETAKTLPDNLDLAALAQGKYSDEAMSSIGALEGLTGKVGEYLGGLVAMGAGTDTVKGKAAELEQAFRDQLKAVGITGEAQEEYIHILGLTPEQIETAIEVSGLELARLQIELYTKLLGEEIPDSVVTRVLTAVEKGDLTAAAGELAAWRSAEERKHLTIHTRLDTGGLLHQFRNSIPDLKISVSGSGNIQARADGGPVSAGAPYIVGEEGPELFVPKASGSIVPNGSLAGGASVRSGAGVQNFFSVNVSAGVGDPVSIGRQVVESIREYERASGPGWRN